MSIDFQALRRLPLDRIREYYHRLSEREQVIVLVSTAGVALVVIVVFFTSLVGSINRLERRIDSEAEIARKIETLRSEYMGIQGQVRRLESVVNRTPGSFSLASHLEELAQSFGLALESMNPKPVPPNDLYKEVQVEVKASKVTLKSLIDYLYRIENSNQVIRINSISIKPNYSDLAYLNAVFSVSAFMSKE